jgi:hypothetical protein
VQETNPSQAELEGHSSAQIRNVEAPSIMKNAKNLLNKIKIKASM